MRRISLLLLLLVACTQVTDYSKQPATTQRSVGGPVLTTRLTVHFVKDVDDILKACPQLTGGTYYGCSVQGQGTCDIYLQEPKDFNDVPRLATFGHEAWHCFGAQHG